MHRTPVVAQERENTMYDTLKRYWPGAVDDVDGLRAVMDEHPDGEWMRYADTTAEERPLESLLVDAQIRIRELERSNREKDAQIAELKLPK